ncbi:FAD-dependent monooxygenase [Nonomuraea sp. NPDC049419]|uniref:FAD-dependent monooxygenase n=1 Tax=Nonomuraea sp. NPDC049419 TaxID=3155772 RepID=UPI00341F188A
MAEPRRRPRPTAAILTTRPPGDAAHLVPIFGVRGMNSAIDDTHNLAWKPAFVTRGAACGNEPGWFPDPSGSRHRAHSTRSAPEGVRAVPRIRGHAETTVRRPYATTAGWCRCCTDTA